MTEFATLKAGEVTIKNESSAEKTIFIYVPNKDSIPCKIAAGKTVTITTLSAGESFTYLAQAVEGLNVTLA